jgi:Uma2 family endonuclease
MTISASPLAPESTTPFHALALLRFPPALRLTPEQFALLCVENFEQVLELASDGQVLAMTPTCSETGARNSHIEMSLLFWAAQQGGWKVFGSSSGFPLPADTVLSPEQRRGFAPLWPDLVVELATPSDHGPRGLTALHSMIAAYQANGALLGWLLIPYQQAVEVWPPRSAS